MSEDHSGQHSYEIRVEGGLSEMFKAAFPDMRSAEVAPCVVLVVPAARDTDAADLALRVQALGHSVLSVRRCVGTGSAAASIAQQELPSGIGATTHPGGA